MSTVKHGECHLAVRKRLDRAVNQCLIQVENKGHPVLKPGNLIWQANRARHGYSFDTRQPLYEAVRAELFITEVDCVT